MCIAVAQNFACAYLNQKGLLHFNSFKADILIIAGYILQAKKTLQEEIDQYIREQIDKAGEAISITVRTKICKDDVILTYGWYGSLLLNLSRQKEGCYKLNNSYTSDCWAQASLKG